MADAPYSTDLRERVEDEIERLVMLLDALDGDPDFEPVDEREQDPDFEADSDDEPWLGWVTLEDGRTLTGGDADMESVF